MNAVNYTYNATVTKVVDGDTLELVIDLGFRIKTTQRARLLGIDTPEINSGTTKERTAGKLAREVTQAWCEDADNLVVITSYKTDSFGRWLVAVSRQQGPADDLTSHLISKGYKGWKA